ncbi:O-antigen ligase family protein [Hymenobacter sp. GOD-10R]|uniref:O-antigen ligase family protein n=1 Tax=Hymenobacter sp. GOD-10R TaxID=3093922 RepID=UPI002D79D6A2|nr:O-antigen ligase family protein [Hymenobacter sp. GOD-10R]WRQ29410.1 O-antigen ligase family protein [Hymenobacter sp. GOD-10R]
MNCIYTTPISLTHRLAEIFCATIIIGLFTKGFLPALSTIGTICLFLTALLYQVANTKEKANRSNWVIYMMPTGVFLVHLFSGLNTEVAHRQGLWEDLLLESPFLLLPLSFVLLPKWPEQYLNRLFLLFFCLVLLSALGSTANYVLHADEINKLYSQSQIMPTVPDYIRFSLMVTFAIVIAVQFVRSKAITKQKRFALIVSVTFLVLYLYLLAVRSGLGAFNALGLFAIVWLVWKRREYTQAIVLATLLILLPAMSFFCFPTFRNKYYNTQYDVAQVQTSGSANNLSLVGRFYSYKVGLQLVRQYPWFGVGKADMEQEVSYFYRRDYPDIDPSSYLMPHNQFLYYLVAFGCIGLMAFLYCFYYPLLVAWQQNSLLLIAHYVIVSCSFIVEFTLDQKNQIGAMYSILFILLCTANMISSKDKQLNQ